MSKLGFKYKYAGFFLLHILLAGIATLAFAQQASGQQVVALYDGEIPNARAAPASIYETFASGMYRHVTAPSLEVYLPEKENATGAAVVICPGGGYSVIVYNGEGVSAAKELAKKGVAAFVLKYRLPDDSL